MRFLNSPVYIYTNIKSEITKPHFVHKLGLYIYTNLIDKYTQEAFVNSIKKGTPFGIPQF